LDTGLIKVCALAVAGALELAAIASASPVQAPKLFGTVGPGYTITLKRDGKLVRTLRAGKYRLVISDRAPYHDFTLEGTRLPTTVITGDGFVGTRTMTLSLEPGTYKYYCALHEPVMSRLFRVVP
jgi:hypothetical protein